MPTYLTLSLVVVLIFVVSCSTFALYKMSVTFMKSLSEAEARSLELVRLLQLEHQNLLNRLQAKDLYTYTALSSVHEPANSAVQSFAGDADDLVAPIDMTEEEVLVDLTSEMNFLLHGSGDIALEYSDKE